MTNKLDIKVPNDCTSDDDCGNHGNSGKIKSLFFFRDLRKNKHDEPIVNFQNVKAWKRLIKLGKVTRVDM